MSSGYLLKPDVEELIGRIHVVDDLREALEKSEVRVGWGLEDRTEQWTSARARG